MPYVNKTTRYLVDQGANPLQPGGLNYKITLLLRQYIKNKGLSYQTINDILGALEGAKLEFYRRIAAPYENGKLSENGDVYD